MSTSEALQPYVDHLSEAPPQFLGQANAVRFALLPIGAGVGYVGLMLFKPSAIWPRTWALDRHG